MIEEVPSKEFLEQILKEKFYFKFDERIYWQNQQNLEKLKIILIKRYLFLMTPLIDNTIVQK